MSIRPQLFEELVIRFKPIISKRRGIALGLWGGAGIGKTHTAKEVLRQLSCQSFSVHSTTPLAKLVTVFPRPRKLEAWTDHILDRITYGESVGVSESVDALAVLLSKLAPLVLHLEDLHEANNERLEFIRKLAQSVKRSKGVGLLLTSRVEFLEPIEGIFLEPLSPESTKSLLEHRAGSVLPQHALEWIYGRSLGNPLFTLEYFRHLSRTGNLWNDGQRWHWRPPQVNSMPSTVEALIEQIIEQLADRHALGAVLQVRAMLPQSSNRLCAQVLGIAEADFAGAWLEFTRHSLVNSEGFVHPLFKEVVERGIPLTQRQRLARAALEVLSDTAARAALVKDAGLSDADSLALLMEAANTAPNPIAAAQFLAQAVDYAPSPQQAAIALRAAEGLKASDVSEAIRLARLAVQLEPNNAAAIYLLAELLTQIGQQTEVHKVLALLPANMRSGPAWLSRLIALKAQLDDHAGILEIWESHPELVQQASLETHCQVGDALLYLGRFYEAEVVIDRILQVSPEAMAQTNAQIVLARVRYYQGRTEESLSILERLPENPNPHLGAIIQYRMGYCLQYLNRNTQALEALEKAYAMFEKIGNGRWCAIVRFVMARVYFVLNQGDLSEELCLQAIDFLSQIDPSDHLVNVHNHLAWYYGHNGTAIGRLLSLKHAKAAYHTAEALQSPRAKINTGVQLSLAHTISGNPQLGLQIARDAIIQLRATQYPYLLGMYLEAEGLALEALGDISGAQVCLQEAIQLMVDHNYPADAEQIGLEADRIRGDVASAVRRLEHIQHQGLLFLEPVILRYFPQLASQPEPQITPSVAQPCLEVLGPMRLEIGGEIVMVRGRRRQQLLAMLLEARLSSQPEVSRLDLLEQVYPGEDELKSGASLKQLVSSLRETLGDTAILTTGSGYALGAVKSDAESFLQTRQPELWRGSYLEGVGLSQGGVEVSDSLHLALKIEADTLLNSNPKEALRLARILIDADPYNLEYLQLCLQALQQIQNYKSLTRLYEAARTRLREVGEHLPPHWNAFILPRA